MLFKLFNRVSSIKYFQAFVGLIKASFSSCGFFWVPKYRQGFDTQPDPELKLFTVKTF